MKNYMWLVICSGETDIGNGTIWKSSQMPDIEECTMGQGVQRMLTVFSGFTGNTVFMIIKAAVI